MALERIDVAGLPAVELFTAPEAVTDYEAPSRTDALVLNKVDASVERFPRSAGDGLAELRAQAQRLSGAVVLPPSLG